MKRRDFIELSGRGTLGMGAIAAGVLPASLLSGCLPLRRTWGSRGGPGFMAMPSVRTRSGGPDSANSAMLVLVACWSTAVTRRWWGRRLEPKG